MIRDRSRVAVIGTGGIGARHVQSMAGISAPIDLDIVDPIPQARQRAISFLREAGGLQCGSVREFSHIEDLDSPPDLAIVATTSRERPRAVKAIVGRGVRSLILEKVLFTRLSDYDEFDGLFANGNTHVWVNCPFRAFPRARRLAELIDGAPFSYRVEGQGWGLACNLIHHLDEFASLNGSADIFLSIEHLHRSIGSAKRDGYIELLGQISGKGGACNDFTAVCSSGPATGRVVQLKIGDKLVTVSREQKKILIDNGAGTRAEPYPMPTQSELTSTYLAAILAGQSPALPVYAEASQIHRVMVDAFIKHLRIVKQDPTLDECPVT